MSRSDQPVGQRTATLDTRRDADAAIRSADQVDVGGVDGESLHDRIDPIGVAGRVLRERVEPTVDAGRGRLSRDVDHRTEFVEQMADEFIVVELEGARVAEAAGGEADQDAVQDGRSAPTSY